MRAQFGNPADHHGNIEMRLLSIENAIAQFQSYAQQKKSSFANELDRHPLVYLKGLGNDVILLSTMRELYFNSREILDNVLIKLNVETKSHEHRTARSFLPFAKQLMQGTYDQYGLNTIEYLKTNFLHIFNIRKVRNELKNKPSNVIFFFDTDHFQCQFQSPINKDEWELLPYLDIPKKDGDLSRLSFHFKGNLDVMFPTMLEFRKKGLSILAKDFANSL